MIGLGTGLIGSIGNLFGNRRANRQLERLISQNPQYKSNPIASQRLGLAQQLLNARMPGAAARERNIYGTQANTLGQINRNATDSSQALALAAGTQGQVNEAFGDLSQQEAGDYQRRYSNLTGAQEGMIQEGNKVYQDQVRRFQDLAAIRGTQNRNRQNTWQGVSNMGFGLMNFGLSGGWESMFGQGGGTGTNMSGGMDRNIPASTYRVPLANI